MMAFHTQKIIVLCVIGSAILGGSFFALNNYIYNEKQKGSGDSLSDWRTYNHREYGFSLKLPPQFSLAQEIRDPDFSIAYKDINQSVTISVTSVDRIRELSQMLTTAEYSGQPATLENLIVENLSWNTYVDKNSLKK
jgi:hypothetical protein